MTHQVPRVHLLLLAAPCFIAASLLPEPTRELAAQEPARAVAITIDDLPVNCTCDAEEWPRITEGLLRALTTRGVPAIGFVNEVKLYPSLRGRGAGQRPDGLEPNADRVALLERWLEAGMELGNHSFSHPDLHATPLAEYQRELLDGERITRTLLVPHDKSPRFFRHPYLRTGRDLAKKRAFERFLEESGYRIAPVTIDNAEWIYARAYDVALDKGTPAGRSEAERVAAAYLDYMVRQTAFFEGQAKKLLGRDMTHVLLLHANRLNAAFLGDLLDRLEARGYRFVSLDEALKDPAYGRRDDYTGRAGMSWVQRWAWAEGHRGDWFAGEPEVEPWLRELSGLR